MGPCSFTVGQRGADLECQTVSANTSRAPSSDRLCVHSKACQVDGWGVTVPYAQMRKLGPGSDLWNGTHLDASQRQEVTEVRRDRHKLE